MAEMVEFIRTSRTPDPSHRGLERGDLLCGKQPAWRFWTDTDRDAAHDLELCRFRVDTGRPDALPGYESSPGIPPSASGYHGTAGQQLRHERTTTPPSSRTSARTDSRCPRRCRPEPDPGGADRPPHRHLRGQNRPIAHELTSTVQPRNLAPILDRRPRSPDHEDVDRKSAREAPCTSASAPDCAETASYGRRHGLRHDLHDSRASRCTGSSTHRSRSAETERDRRQVLQRLRSRRRRGHADLRLNWPRHPPTTPPRGQRARPSRPPPDGQPRPVRPGSLRPADFLQVYIYDNVDTRRGVPPASPIPAHPSGTPTATAGCSSTPRANVGDDRHRILILAEKQQWQLSFPATLALWSSVVDSNGQGFQVSIEKGTPAHLLRRPRRPAQGVDPQPAAGCPAADTHRLGERCEHPDPEGAHEDRRGRAHLLRPRDDSA